MARIFITGSADGLGRMAGEQLVQQGHEVIFHARHDQRADDLRRRVPTAKTIVVGDLSSIAQTRAVADQVNRLAPLDVMIHNAAVGYQEPSLIKTEDGLPHVFAINTLAPYLLTALIQTPKRLIFTSSALHHSAETSLDDLLWTKRTWDGSAAYAESKFHDVLLAFAAARLFPNKASNALEPGWVPTKMGGPNAPGDLNAGSQTQVWLASSENPGATGSGHYFYHQKLHDANPAAQDTTLQDRLVSECEDLSGVPWVTAGS